MGMNSPRFRGVIFDMDGTLTYPVIDFPAIREELGMGNGDIAHHILSLPREGQAAAWAVVERHEDAALRRQAMKDGMQALLWDLRERGVHLAVVTRNAQRSVDALCAKFDIAFDTVVTRDFPYVKPHPGAVRHILREWKMAAADALMVGDYVHDIECGRAAGTRTCFFQNPGFPNHGAEADFIAHSADDVRRIVL